MQSLLLKLQADVEARKRPGLGSAATWRNVLLAFLLLVMAYELGARSAVSASARPAGVGGPSDWRERFGAAPAAAPEGELDFQKLQVERLRSAFHYSTRYRIPADLAAAIEDIARAEGVDVDLAFELVRVESEFNARAVSPVGALGYTQLMPATARLMQPGLTREQIFDRDTNLRLGFRYLKEMLKKYDGNTRLALLAYNRGPGRVDQLRRMGVDPSNGYASLILGRLER